ncbi:hypothetical protein [uncultured Bacteroides sp.]|uniref:hypothetical protein n=1 Tax=uncultured Bacteroides sp. TaxID=162156 RepID=UPI002AAB3639|nr:hypothetical protein [uncultured Bacteroides sp.]
MVRGWWERKVQIVLCVLFLFVFRMRCEWKDENSDRTLNELRLDFERTPVGVCQKAGGSLPAIQE